MSLVWLYLVLTANASTLFYSYFFLLDFVFSADQDLEENNDDETTNKLKSAVHAFLEKNLNSPEPELDQKSPDTIYVEMDNQTGEIISHKTQTIRRPDGSSRTVKTVEKIKNKSVKTENNVGEAKIMKIMEIMNIEDVDEDTIEGKDMDEFVDENTKMSYKEIPQFINMISFLKSANEAVQKVIEEVTYNNPKVLSELLSIDFSDLLKVFQLIFVKSASIEEAYQTLFDGVGQMGATKFIDKTLEIEQSKEQRQDSQVEEIVRQFVSILPEEGRNIADMLGSEKISKLVGEYLKNIEFETHEDDGKQVLGESLSDRGENKSP